MVAWMYLIPFIGNTTIIKQYIFDPEAKISRQLIVIKEARKLLKNGLYYQVDIDNQIEKNT